MLIRVSSPLLSLLVLASFQALLVAQETGEEEKERRNSAELFLGAVTETAESATGAGIGIEYKRLLSERWSLGIEAIEISTNDVSRSWLVVVPVYFRVVGGLGLKAGPGIEGSKTNPVPGSPSETTTQFAMRFGAGWEFEVGSRYTITPEINLDVVGGDITLVYGFSFGLGF